MDTNTILNNFKLKNFNHPDKYGEWVGYKLNSFDIETKSAVSSLKIRTDHLSPTGRVHGGVISGFFDFACGAAVFTTLEREDLCSTVELKVNYLRPIELEDELIAKTNVIFRGKRTCVVHGFIYNGELKAAMASATFNIANK